MEILIKFEFELGKLALKIASSGIGMRTEFILPQPSQMEMIKYMYI